MTSGPRVWDEFLTAADRASLRPRSELNWGFGRRPALLLIDLYRSVFGDEPQPLAEATRLWPSSCGLNGWKALPQIQRLLAGAREARLPVVHLTGSYEVDSGIRGWSPAARSGRWGELADERALERHGRRFDIIDEVAPQPGEAVLRKTAPSAFWGTPLVGHLTDLRIDTLIVCGESTSGCVRATVVDGRSHRFNVVVAEDAVFDRHAAPHAVNLFDMHEKYADVLPVDRIISHITGSSETASEFQSREQCGRPDRPG